MEISSISGADSIPSGFSTEAPRNEESVEREAETVEKPEQVTDSSKGSGVDHYA